MSELLLPAGYGTVGSTNTSDIPVGYRGRTICEEVRRAWDFNQDDVRCRG